jgi:hypothetical protein
MHEMDFDEELDVYGSVGFWGWPSDEDASSFDADYVDRYLPLCRTLPGVIRLDAFVADADGRETGIYRIGGVYFEDKAAYEAATASPEWTELGALGAYLLERYKVDLRFAAVHD